MRSDKDRARDAAYYRAHKNERAAYQKTWAERNHERVLRLAHDRYYRTDIRKRFALRANRKARTYGRPHDTLDYRTLPLGPWICTYCGVFCESWDHVEQLVLGGANDVSNLVPSCVPCNQHRTRQTRRQPIARCANGHEMSGSNVYWYPNGKHRRCRACGRAQWHKRKSVAEFEAA